MPTYTLRCKFCHHEHEISVHSYERMAKELAMWACPKCGSKAYEKIPALTSWHFGDSMRAK